MSLKKPSEKEEEYFVKLEFEKRKKEAMQRQKRMEEEERKKAKELHYMRCPKCGMELIEITFQNVKIDRCSSCSGLWLDEGELEEIMKKDKLLTRVICIFKK